MTTRDMQWAKCGRYVWGYFWFAMGSLVPSVLGWAFAADTLPAVSPPTDWTGVAIVAAIAVLAVAIAAYIVHIKRTPGLQLGEEQIEHIAEALYRKQAAPAAIAGTALTYDGIAFASDEKLAEYKAAKAVVDAFKTGATP